jgi:LuxR family maltose regulon positive regulatory protein
MSVSSIPDRIAPEQTVQIDSVLSTKLAIPSTRGEVVPRPRLLEKLGKPPRPFTLISAPAGFGKTTLMANWISHIDLPVAWLSLDSDDNDPNRFLTYLIASMKSVKPEFGDAVNKALRSSSTPAMTTLLAALINEMNSFDHDFVFILDDFHQIIDSGIHELLSYLLDYQPPQMYLAMTSRTEPPLALPRLRVRQQLVEINEADLRFNLDETKAFLNKLMGLNLDAEDIAVLEQRTEGWIAGLQLAALSMQGGTDSHQFIQSFTGDDRHIMDYLTDEVLHQQSALAKTFLLQTSVLDRLCAPLCEAVTNLPDCKAILESLEQNNMFLIPLDHKRNWYRYHHLFADLLSHQLKETQPDKEIELHTRASRWFAENGLIDEAINHAFVAQNHELVAEYLDEHGYEIFYSGRVSTLVNWFRKLPDPIIHNKANRLLLSAWVYFSGTDENVLPLLDAAERLLGQTTAQENPGCNDQDEACTKGEIQVIRGFSAMHQGRLHESMHFINQAKQLLPEQGTVKHVAPALLEGVVLYGIGDIKMAEKTLLDGVQISIKHNNALAIVYILSGLIRTYTKMGRFQKARNYFHSALDILKERGWDTLDETAFLYMALGEVLREQNDLQASEECYLHAMDLIKYVEWDTSRVMIKHMLARVKLANGEIEQAKAMLVDVADTEHQDLLFPIFSTIENYRGRINLMLGNASGVDTWLKKNPLQLDGDFDPTIEEHCVILVRILLAQQQFDEAIKWSAKLLPAAEKANRTAVVIEILVLQSLARHAQGNSQQALATLERAMKLAEPEGFMRIFLDEGKPMATLLKRMVDKGVEKDYADRLLGWFDEHIGTTLQTAISRAGISEPLSRKENDTLQLLAAGLTNKEIAEQLFVSPNTVKTHLKNIFEKLQVSNRNQAIAKARDLNLV